MHELAIRGNRQGMNDPTHPATAGSPAYWDDSYGWALAQADLIRSKKLTEIDWEQLAEELEDMARSEYRALESALRILLLHLLKWDIQSAFRSRSWLNSIEEHGRRYRRLIEENPSLRQHLDQILSNAYDSARCEAVAETGLPLEAFPADPPGWNVINNPPVREDDLPVR